MKKNSKNIIKIKRLNRFSYEDFIKIIDIFIYLKKFNFFEEEILEKDFECLSKILSNIFVNIEKREIFKNYILATLEKLECIEKYDNELKNREMLDSLLRYIFDLKNSRKNEELSLLYDMVYGLQSVLSELILYKQSLDFLEFMNFILKNIDIHYFTIEKIKEIENSINELKNSLEKFKKALQPPNKLKAIYYTIIEVFSKILGKEHSLLEKQVRDLLNKNKNLLRILEIDISNLLNDERYRKITISRINDYLSKFNDLKKINFFKSISQIADIFKKYEDEIYKKNLTALYYEVITFLNEEINKSLISNYRLYETYKTLALIGVIIDFLLNKENNPVIKILLETYKDRENFIYQGLKYSYYFITKIDFLRIKLNALNGILINSLKLENIILLKDLSLEEYKNFYKLSTFLYENNITNPDKIFICVILKEILENIEILDDIDSLKERLDKIKKDININSKEILSNVISICKEKEDNNEPVIISTADGFQGDERDVIIYSLRYAPNSSPQIIRSLLSLNEFGENRLNVALTRARRKMVFFISRDIEEFPSSLLKDFLFYAKGFSISNIIDKEFDSDFERDVYERLIKKGYRLYPQYKDCGYKIDLALFIENLRIGDGWQHYDKDGELNIYDIERQEILERAGWIILRIPSTQYWKDPDGYIERLIEKINNIIENHKKKNKLKLK